MKLAIAVLLTASCGAPPSDVDEIQQAQEIGNPFGSVSQTIRVGRRIVGNVGHGVLFQRNDSLACWWEPISESGGRILAGTVNVYGADQNDFMEIFSGLSGQAYCSALNGVTWGAVVVLSPPNEINGPSGTHIVLNGMASPAGTTNTLVCAGGAQAFPADNSTSTIGDSRQYAYSTNCTLNGGSGRDYFNAMAQNGSNTDVHIRGGAGNDCATWNGPLNIQPVGTMGTNTAAGDTARGWSSTLASIEFVNTPPYKCGF